MAGALGGRRGGGVGPVVDDAFHDDGGGEFLHAGQGGEVVVPQGLVGLEAGGGDAQEVVGVAEEPFRVADLRDGGQALLEVGDGGGVFTVHGDMEGALEAQADGGGVDEGRVAADHPGAFQFAQPPVAGGDAEPGALGEFGDGEPPLLLKLGKYLPVYRVHYKDYCAIPR